MSFTKQLRYYGLSVSSWLMSAMEDIPSVSQTELVERRRKLRRQRRSRVLQASWQILVLSGLTTGLIWVVTLPDWMIQDPGQIVIEGNKTLAPDTVRALLSLHYPQFLLTLKPQEITQHLEAQAPIAEVTVTRHLFPPSLTVRIRERYPVAVVYSVASPGSASVGSANAGSASAGSASPGSANAGSVNPAVLKKPRTPAILTPVALLDEKGTVISYENYVTLNQSQQLPALKVIGSQDQLRSQWLSLYRQVSRSPVRVSEIDWRDPGNLILHTELGTVYMGAYGDRFAEQLQVLDRMRQLPKNVDPSQIAYIDLRSPNTPLLEMIDSGVVRPPKAAIDSSE